jgi:hypothetical protein
LSHPRGVRSFRIDLTRAAVDRVLVDPRERRLAKMLDYGLEKSLRAARFKITQRRLGEGASGTTTADGFFEEFALAPDTDLFGSAAVRSFRTLFNATPRTEPRRIQ